MEAFRYAERAEERELTLAISETARRYEPVVALA